MGSDGAIGAGRPLGTPVGSGGRMLTTPVDFGGDGGVVEHIPERRPLGGVRLQLLRVCVVSSPSCKPQS